ncbi:MAG TPA: hypothetical protein VEY09_11720 [Pyrinomonadaceae bacterium]|nr:hypothetical protein [Pyrinomonadaceae bacterium]
MRESNKKTFRAAALLGACALALCAAGGAAAQTASTTYKGTPRDPFVKYKPPVRRKVVKKVATPVEPPSIQARIEQYRALKAAAMNAQRPAPKPTTALLLKEVQVVGVFRTPRGYAAMVEATPINLSYVVYPGESFYDGMLVAIEETRLVFRRQTRWTDGRVEVAVEAKPLRQPNVVNDPMTTTRTAGKDEAQPSAPAPQAARDEKVSEMKKQ